jgi:hypothetical protein
MKKLAALGVIAVVCLFAIGLYIEAQDVVMVNPKAVNESLLNDLASAEMERRYPGTGFVVVAKYPHAREWSYELYRYEFFGRPLLMAKGKSWAEAFQNLDDLLKRPRPVPFP